MRPIPQLSPLETARFWMRAREVHRGHLIKGAPSACWEWQGNLNDQGYGRYLRSKFRVHRIAIVLLGGADPGDSGVFHRCDNPRCLRPTHLFVGTQADNLADMARKGRGRKSRLTPAQMESIRRTYAEGRMTHRELGRLYGVSGSHIGLIVRGKLQSQRKQEA